MRVLDAGCGSGRNLVYLLRSGYEVFGADSDADAIESVRRLAATLAPHLSAENFRVEPVEHMTFPDAFADVVLSSAVLHFARDDRQFAGHGARHVAGPQARRHVVLPAGLGDWHGDPGAPHSGRRFLLPDGSERYLVDEAMLVELTRELGGTLLDPLKTTIVQNQRCMTTWVVRKGCGTSRTQGSRRVARVVAAVVLAISTMAACGRSAKSEPVDPYLADIAKFREAREAVLKTDTGWLTIAGLFFLTKPETSFGSDTANDIVLPAGAPARAGTFVLHDGKVAVKAASGVSFVLNGNTVTNAI